MSQKSLVMLGLVVGSTLGGLVPTLLGASFFSFWPILTSAIGGIIGIVAAYKLVE